MKTKTRSKPKLPVDPAAKLLDELKASAAADEESVVSGELEMGNTTLAADVTWVYLHVDHPRVQRVEAGSAGRWNLLLWARDERSRFYRSVLPKVLTAKAALVAPVFARCHVARMAELPQLTGTPKQKKWAAIIRACVVAEMRRCGPGGWGDDRQLRAFAAILANAEATWWIERRWESLDDLVLIAELGLASARREKRHAIGQSEGERRIQDSTLGAADSGVH